MSSTCTHLPIKFTVVLLDPYMPPAGILVIYDHRTLYLSSIYLSILGVLTTILLSSALLLKGRGGAWVRGYHISTTCKWVHIIIFVLPDLYHVTCSTSGWCSFVCSSATTANKPPSPHNYKFDYA